MIETRWYNGVSTALDVLAMAMVDLSKARGTKQIPAWMNQVGITMLSNAIYHLEQEWKP